MKYNKLFFDLSLSMTTIALLSSCKVETAQDTTTPAVNNPYPKDGVSLIDNGIDSPRLRFHDGGVENNAPRIFKESPNIPEYLVSPWYIAQWKKTEIMMPNQFDVNPSYGIDSVLGGALYSFYTPSNQSHIWVFKNSKNNKFVYELFGQHGWLDTGGGSNVFLSGNFQDTTLNNRVDLNFDAKISKRITDYIANNSSKDGSVVSQFISGMPMYYQDPTGEGKNISLFMQITHADSRKPNYLAPGKMTYTGCYLNDLGQRQIVFGDNAANALGGNGFIANEDPNGDLKSYSYSINSQLCIMLKKNFNCPNGEVFTFPKEAFDLKNWHMGSLYIGLETQDAFAENMNSIPTTRGPDRGKVELAVQISDLKLMKYPKETIADCSGANSNSDNIPADPSENVNTGYFCSGNNKILYQCGRSSSPGSTWVNVGNNCYHKDSGASDQCKTK